MCHRLEQQANSADSAPDKLCDKVVSKAKGTCVYLRDAVYIHDSMRIKKKKKVGKDSGLSTAFCRAVLHP